MSRQINHNNIFESYIAHDMKQTERKPFTKENFEEFVSDEFLQWVELGLQTYVEEEWGENE